MTTLLHFHVLFGHVQGVRWTPSHGLRLTVESVVRVELSIGLDLEVLHLCNAIHYSQLCITINSCFL